MIQMQLVPANQVAMPFPPYLSLRRLILTPRLNQMRLPTVSLCPSVGFLQAYVVS